MKKVIMALVLLSSMNIFAMDCHPGHSAASLSKIINDPVETSIVEERGDKLYYTLQISFSKVSEGSRSASNTILVFATLLANKNSFNQLAALAQAIKDRKIRYLCLRPSESSYYRDRELPPRFVLDYGKFPGLYEMDLK